MLVNYVKDLYILVHCKYQYFLHRNNMSEFVIVHSEYQYLLHRNNISEFARFPEFCLMLLLGVCFQVVDEIWICEKQTVTKWEGDIFEYKETLAKKVRKQIAKLRDG